MHRQQTGWILALSLATILGSVAGCHPANEFQAPPPPEVTVAKPAERNVADSMEFIGRTSATATVELRSRVKGYLQKIEFEDGAHVQVGQPLFLIDQGPYKVTLDAAKAALQKAQAELVLAQTQYRRMEPLVAQRAVAQEELDIQAAKVNTTQADVVGAQAAVDSALLDLEYTQIRAPIAGDIGRHLVDVGTLIQAELTPLAVIQSIDPIYAEFDISESDLLRFMGMIRRHQLPDPKLVPPTLYLGLENEEGFPHEGKLEYRELGVDPATGTTRRRAIFANPNRELLPGMFGRIHADIGAPMPRLLVEERALGTDQRGTFVLVVNDKNEVEYRPVKLGSSFDGMRVIEDGVGPNDRVVVNGLQRARPGAQVRPVEAVMGEAVMGEAGAATPAAAAQGESKQSEHGGQSGPMEPVVEQPSPAPQLQQPPQTQPVAPQGEQK